MLKKLLLSSLILFYSCNYFQVEKVTSEEILEEELKTFSWDEVDTYPKFSSSSAVASSKEEEAKQFSNRIANSLNEDSKLRHIVVETIQKDTVLVHLKISSKGIITVKNILIDSITETQIPKLRNSLLEAFSNLPEVLPALKRGRPVQTEFTLPIKLQAQ